MQAFTLLTFLHALKTKECLFAILFELSFWLQHLRFGHRVNSDHCDHKKCFHAIKNWSETAQNSSRLGLSESRDRCHRALPRSGLLCFKQCLSEAYVSSNIHINTCNQGVTAAKCHFICEWFQCCGWSQYEACVFERQLCHPPSGAGLVCQKTFANCFKKKKGCSEFIHDGDGSLLSSSWVEAWWPCTAGNMGTWRFRGASSSPSTTFRGCESFTSSWLAAKTWLPPTRKGAVLMREYRVWKVFESYCRMLMWVSQRTKSWTVHCSGCLSQRFVFLAVAPETQSDVFSPHVMIMHTNTNNTPLTQLLLGCQCQLFLKSMCGNYILLFQRIM